jgi:hypothetical protein
MDFTYGYLNASALECSQCRVEGKSADNSLEIKRFGKYVNWTDAARPPPRKIDRDVIDFVALRTR